MAPTSTGQNRRDPVGSVKNAPLSALVVPQNTTDRAWLALLRPYAGRYLSTIADKKAFTVVTLRGLMLSSSANSYNQTPRNWAIASLGFRRSKGLSENHPRPAKVARAVLLRAPCLPIKTNVVSTLTPSGNSAQARATIDTKNLAPIALVNGLSSTPRYVDSHPSTRSTPSQVVPTLSR